MEKHSCFYPTPHPILIWAQDRIFHLYKALKREVILRTLNSKGVYSPISEAFPHNKISFQRKTESSHSAESTQLQQGTACSASH